MVSTTFWIIAVDLARYLTENRERNFVRGFFSKRWKRECVIFFAMNMSYVGEKRWKIQRIWIWFCLKKFCPEEKQLSKFYTEFLWFKTWFVVLLRDKFQNPYFSISRTRIYCYRWLNSFVCLERLNNGEIIGNERRRSFLRISRVLLQRDLEKFRRRRVIG